ncbi:MAG: Aspartyl-tRNA(Asn) amidotransferase subunit B @ Glutamyl-tRNA(Gln) amidotransferase subunit B [uncultured Solirubrobacterales bacterium]|uniref:Aspartyl/glutamyl-tRNA(Asn/Gln) amidotransferase subunit B n=1 Tax=uncultured Solirubrobacterales bacterium TaxID=768556 RepID=A0A6J4SE80_9ACTN|nr:MAG: Aspartyl-tRNA(Asn) amidotransferase subunit B @ Glutamyl-tRNA(Gln) amidotransferase subunit B [uncultured Solirubrobacterales bacterium]
MTTVTTTPVERAYEPTIGLEIHVQLKTRTKMFCGCALSFGDEPNTHTCQICLGHPGTLPVPNAEAIHFALMIGMALECELSPRSIFHRKNYFYPDLPKGYQISQFDIPLWGHGRLGDVRIHRVHLEEDAAKLVHAGSSGRIHGAEASVVDFNRGGTPLVEIVTEPDLTSPAQAGEWLRLLRATLGRLGVSDVNMDEGSLRCDANVSIRPVGTADLGTKTELKNMNSFRFLERGVAAEIARQEEIVHGGGQVVQETLHYDPTAGTLTPLRSKEESHDYRYFPEPDLVPLAPTEAMLSRARAALPELPAARAERFERELALAPETARLLAFRSELGDFFEAGLADTASSDEGGDGDPGAANGATAETDPRTLASWITVELVPRLGDADPADSAVEPAALAELVRMVSAREVSGSAAKEVLDAMAAEGGRPTSIVAERGLGLAAADELRAIVDRAIEENPDAVEKIRAGKNKAMGAIVGSVMRETKGRADGGEVGRMVRERLGLG